MGQLISNLPIGSLIKLNENGQSKKFIKLDNDHYGEGTGVTLIRKDTFNERQWEASYDSSYKNRYIGCLLDNFCDLMWPQMLDPEIRECVVPVPIVVAEGNGVSTPHTINRRGFALSATEAGLSGWITEGTPFAYFSDNEKRIACFDESTAAVYWGLRSPLSNATSAYCVNTVGALSNNDVYYAHFASRPAFNLKSSILVSDEVDSDGCYTVNSLPRSGGGVYVKQDGVWVRAT